ncbi:MAG TPA: amidohydrolase family protein [Pyrinomonadaceae bacterium]|nr:amidohydrolase family protein [Pyrinomonadaceae bacterium]
MPKVRSRLPVAVLALLLVALSLDLNTNAQRSAIDTYAITNARLVTVSGPVIERGTVVIRNGLIAAAGADVHAPPDARVIDGTGLTVYPGLIDSYTDLGLPEPSPSPSPATGLAAFLPLPSPSPRGGPNSTQPAGLQPEVMVEDVIRTGGTEIESWRSIGITTALTTPRTGIWMGQSALINLSGETPQQMIVRSPVAMHVGFTPLRGIYPGSLLGVFSTLRQMMLDAQRYRDSMAIYERNPRGTRRPDTDRSLAALIPVVDGRMPVVMLVNTEREITRALDLASEFKLRLIIAGGREADRVAERLAKQNVPVLLSLNLPKRTTPAMAEADPEPMRVLRERVEAQQTAGKLVKAGVRFGFQSGSLTDIADLMGNARRVIENGLSAADAVRAFTIWPAQILGVESQLGSIEAGKIANLTVTRGDLFTHDTRVAHVFIDGRPVDLRPPTGGPSRNVLSGMWSVTVNLGQSDRSISLNLRQEGDRLTGSISGPLGAGEISNASVTSAGEVRFTVALNVEGLTSEATFAGTLANNEIRGTVTIVGSSPGTFTATRSEPRMNPD